MGCLRVGGTVWNTLTGGETEKSVGQAKILKRGGAALKSGDWNPLKNYVW